MLIIQLGQLPKRSAYRDKTGCSRSTVVSWLWWACMLLFWFLSLN